MKYTQKEILEAIELIQDICVFNDRGCEVGRCPFYHKQKKCLFSIEPHEWEGLKKSDETQKPWDVFL